MPKHKSTVEWDLALAWMLVWAGTGMKRSDLFDIREDWKSLRLSDAVIISPERHFSPARRPTYLNQFPEDAWSELPGSTI